MIVAVLCTFIMPLGQIKCEFTKWELGPSTGNVTELCHLNVFKILLALTASQKCNCIIHRSKVIDFNLEKKDVPPIL